MGIGGGAVDRTRGKENSDGALPTSDRNRMLVLRPQNPKVRQRGLRRSAAWSVLPPRRFDRRFQSRIAPGLIERLLIRATVWRKAGSGVLPANLEIVFRQISLLGQPLILQIRCAHLRRSTALCAPDCGFCQTDRESRKHPQAGNRSVPVRPVLAAGSDCSDFPRNATGSKTGRRTPWESTIARASRTSARASIKFSK